MTHPTGHVDIPGLAKVGRAVTDSAEALAKAYTAQADALRPGPALTGWATGTALATGSDAWVTFMKALSAEVQSFGADLTRSASDYQSTDDGAAARLRTSGAGHPAWNNVYGQEHR